MVRCLYTLAIVACWMSSALADVSVPLGWGYKRIPYENVVKLATEIPGYKFYQYSGSAGSGGLPTIEQELQLGTEKGVVVPRRSSASKWAGVVAVPEKLMAELQTKENLAELLSSKNRDKLPPNVVVFTSIGPDKDVKSSDPRTKVEYVITISKDETVGVKFTALETPAPPYTDTHLIMMVGAGIAIAVAVVTLGLYLFRRRKRIAQEPA